MELDLEGVERVEVGAADVARGAKQLLEEGVLAGCVAGAVVCVLERAAGGVERVVGLDLDGTALKSPPSTSPASS